MARRNKPRITKREGALSPELRRAVDRDQITKERALRLVEAGGAAVEEKLPDPDKPVQNVVALRVNEAVIDWLVRRAHITRSQWWAARLLRDHFDRSGLEQLRAVDWTREVVDGGTSKPEPLFKEKHLLEFNRAVRELGPLASPVVTDVVLRDRKVEECRASSHYSNQRDRKTEIMTKLRDGLSRLAVHFRLPQDW